VRSARYPTLEKVKGYTKDGSKLVTVYGSMNWFRVAERKLPDLAQRKYTIEHTVI